MGCIYKRGNIFWIKYYRAGKPYQESSKSTKESGAKKLLKLREGHIADGKFSGLKVERIKFDELAEDLINDYKVNGRKSLDRIELSIKNLKSFFEGIKAVNISTDLINAYILKRQEDGRANGTINRELTALKRMFKLGTLSTPPKVVSAPHIPHLKEAAPRSGYFEHEEYKSLLDALPSHLKPVITTAYHTGMRKEEILSLRWKQVDFIEGKITLEAGTTKNDDGRTIYMEGELLEVIRFQKASMDRNHPKCPWVFFHHKTGERMGSFRKSWASACKTANLEGKIFHDFRRTGIRNMVRAGIPERVAMMISGHKTRNVFERYNIVNEDDLKRASSKINKYHRERNVTKSAPKVANGYNLVTIKGESGIEEGYIENVTLQ